MRGALGKAPSPNRPMSKVSIPQERAPWGRYPPPSGIFGVLRRLGMCLLRVGCSLCVGGGAFSSAEGAFSGFIRLQPLCRGVGAFKGSGGPTDCDIPAGSPGKDSPPLVEHHRQVQVTVQPVGTGESSLTSKHKASIDFRISCGMGAGLNTDLTG